MSHHTQRSRKYCVQKVRELIMYYGGWEKINATIGERPFSFHIAAELGCTSRKAQEYITQVIQSAIAEKRLEEMRNEK